MNFSIKVTVLALILALFITSTGCQEQQSGINNKRARLVANQNMQLKKQLAEKDREIQRQKDLVVKCETAMEKQQQTHEQAADGMLRIMRSLVESEAKVLQLEAQIEQLQNK